MDITIAIGDTHGRGLWKSPAYNEKYSKFKFIGDYFDSWDITTVEQIRNFEDIIEFKKANPDKVSLMIGNHDLHYFPEIGYTGTSGYQVGGKFSIEEVVNRNREYLQMADYEDNVLFTHAGVGVTWMKGVIAAIGEEHNLTLPIFTAKEISDFVNKVWEIEPKFFNFTGWNGTGDDVTQTPVWIRPKSLMRDARPIRDAGVIQVVGHTGFKKIDIEGKTTGKRYFFIDVLSTSKEYLVIDNREFFAQKIN